MSKITEADTDLDRHIGGLMAAVMDHFSRNKRIVFGELLIYIDCFSLLLKAAGFDSDEIRTIYPRVTKTIVDLYPSYIDSTAEGASFTGSRTQKRHLITSHVCKMETIFSAAIIYLLSKAIEPRLTQRIKWQTIRNFNEVKPIY